MNEEIKDILADIENCKSILVEYVCDKDMTYYRETEVELSLLERQLERLLNPPTQEVVIDDCPF